MPFSNSALELEGARCLLLFAKLARIDSNSSSWFQGSNRYADFRIHLPGMPARV